MPFDSYSIIPGNNAGEWTDIDLAKLTDGMDDTGAHFFISDPGQIGQAPGDRLQLKDSQAVLPSRWYSIGSVQISFKLYNQSSEFPAMKVRFTWGDNVELDQLYGVPPFGTVTQTQIVNPASVYGEEFAFDVRLEVFDSGSIPVSLFLSELSLDAFSKTRDYFDLSEVTNISAIEWWADSRRDDLTWIETPGGTGDGVGVAVGKRNDDVSSWTYTWHEGGSSLQHYSDGLEDGEDYRLAWGTYADAVGTTDYWDISDESRVINDFTWDSNPLNLVLIGSDQGDRVARVKTLGGTPLMTHYLYLWDGSAWTDTGVSAVGLGAELEYRVPTGGTYYFGVRTNDLTGTTYFSMNRLDTGSSVEIEVAGDPILNLGISAEESIMPSSDPSIVRPSSSYSLTAASQFSESENPISDEISPVASTGVGSADALLDSWLSGDAQGIIRVSISLGIQNAAGLFFGAIGLDAGTVLTELYLRAYYAEYSPGILVGGGSVKVHAVDEISPSPFFGSRHPLSVDLTTEFQQITFSDLGGMRSPPSQDTFDLSNLLPYLNARLSAGDYSPLESFALAFIPETGQDLGLKMRNDSPYGIALIMQSAETIRVMGGFIGIESVEVVRPSIPSVEARIAEASPEPSIKLG